VDSKNINQNDKFHLRWTLKIKFITFITLLIVVIMIFNGMFIIIREKRLLMAKIENESTALVKSLAIPVTNVFLYKEVGLLHEEELLENYISQLMEEKYPILYAMILDNENRVLVHSDLKKFGSIYNDPISENALRSWQTITQKYHDKNWGDVLDASAPLAISSKRWGTLRIGFSLEPIQARIQRLYWEILGLTLGIVLLAFFIVNILSRKLTAPLSILITEMKKTSVEQERQPLAIHSSDEIGYLACAFEDMRERLINSHRELKQAQDQLIRAEKLASIGRLSSGVAHEINNPLNGMQNCIRMILEEPENREQTGRYLELIDEGLQKIESVVQKLLDYSRKDPIMYEKVDVNHSLKKMLELLEYKFSKQNINIELQLDDNLPLIRGDAHLLEQAFLNLMINAYDAMPEGGTLTIRTKQTTRKRRKFVTVVIQDTGEGIPESELTRIFDPFYTTKDVGEGTGLGLSVCQGIIENHQGEIFVKSKAGQGAVFTIFLPVKSK